MSETGLRLGVCTSKRQDFALKILALFNLPQYFDFIDGGDIGIKKRQQLSDLLNAGHIDQTAIMIGDRNIDILAAKANNLRSIGVLWGFGGSAELAAAEPDYIVDEIGDLVRLVT